VKGLELARLLQLASPSLPIGGFSHSHGLESAVLEELVRDEATALGFIADVFEFSMRTFEIPMLLAMHAAWAAERGAALTALNEEYMATRESAELRAASAQMGYSLRALLALLPDMPRATLGALQAMQEPSLPCAWSAAAAAFGIEAPASALAYAWSWAENQVLAALKAVPLGQSAGQRILLALGTRIAQALEHPLPDLALAASNFAPALAILSARHETQYSRLFRS
jgi:urease accessory protein